MRPLPHEAGVLDILPGFVIPALFSVQAVDWRMRGWPMVRVMVLAASLLMFAGVALDDRFGAALGAGILSAALLTCMLSPPPVPSR